MCYTTIRKGAALNSTRPNPEMLINGCFVFIFIYLIKYNIANFLKMNFNCCFIIILNEVSEKSYYFYLTVLYLFKMSISPATRNTMWRHFNYCVVWDFKYVHRIYSKVISPFTKRTKIPPEKTRFCLHKATFMNSKSRHGKNITKALRGCLYIYVDYYTPRLNHPGGYS